MAHIQRFLRENKATLLKTASYYFVHIFVAAAVAYAVTGDWVASLTLSLLEPSVQAVAYFLHEKVWARAGLQRMRTLVKTFTYYVMHLVVAACVAYSVTGNLIAALTLSLLEPTVQMAFFFLHEKLWERKKAAKQLTQHRIIEIVCAKAQGCEMRGASCSQSCGMRHA